MIILEGHEHHNACVCLESESAGKYQSPEQDYEDKVTVWEVFEALNSLYLSDDDRDEPAELLSEGEVSIASFNQVLRDLFEMQLIYFDTESSQDDNRGDDIDPAQFFRGMDIKDLRTSD